MPLFPVGAYAFLVLLSFVHEWTAALVAADKLILLTVGLSPVVFISGAVISMIALFKSQAKVTAVKGLILNITLLIVLLCFCKPILIEFEFVI
ncbi:MAG: hypothetical protein ACYS1A_05210 [Planctomycetota bacterium]|jgi:hypothetical protein